jgi:hypothetical protein
MLNRRINHFADVINKKKIVNWHTFFLKHIREYVRGSV